MTDQKTVTPAYSMKSLDTVIREHLEHALTIYRWHMTRAAEALDVDRRTLYRMIARFKLERPAELPPETRAACATCGKEAPGTDPPLAAGFEWYCSPACSRPNAKPQIPNVPHAT